MSNVEIVVEPDDVEADDVVDVVEAVADAVADVAEEVAEAVADAVDGDGEIERAVDLEHRMTVLEQQMWSALTTNTGVDYGTVRTIVDEYVTDLAALAAEVAADVAEEVAEEVADEEATDDDADVDVTIVEPDVSEAPERRSRWRSIW